MSRAQIDKFVTLYTPRAKLVKEIVDRQWGEDSSPRSLVRNPFYLRALTRVVEEIQAPDGGLPPRFAEALKRRGRLLEFLLTERLATEFPDAEAERAEVLRGLGELAYYMLERNLTGAIFPEIIRERLKRSGLSYEQVIETGARIDLFEIRERDPLTIEFNHQLFLEILLAMHFRRLSATARGFEEGLSLLSRQGERWAETLRLLFEMSSDSQRATLIERFVGALRTAGTWDIATKILSEVATDPGTRGRLAGLIGAAATDELTLKGVVTALGRQRSIGHAGELASLYAHGSEQVRRAAVEALTAMDDRTRMERFAEDRSPIVIRAYYKGRLRLDPDFLGTVPPTPLHREQLAWAIHDLAPELFPARPYEQVVKAVTLLTRDDLVAVQLLGFLTAGRAPDHIQWGLKPQLLDGAVKVKNATINAVARRVVAGLLNAEDIQRLEVQTRVTVFGGLMASEEAVRAYSLLIEVRERVSLRDFLETLETAPPAILVLFVRRLAARGDSTALGILTALLAHPTVGDHAFAATCSMGRRGIAYLLGALSDPQNEVRLAAAERLQFSVLPSQLARSVRRILREHDIRSYEVRGLRDFNWRSLDPGFEMDQTARNFELAFLVAAFKPISDLVSAAGLYLGGRFIGFSVPVWYWYKYSFYASPPRMPFLVSSSQTVHVWIPLITRVGATITPPTPDVAFWIARARLLRSRNEADAARLVLRHCLTLNPDNPDVRFEMAVLERSDRQLEAARQVIEENPQLLSQNPGLAALHRLINSDLQADRDGPVAQDPWARIALLVELELWDEALVLILECYGSSDTAKPEFFEYLYQAYRGKRQLNRAVAAAMRNNAWDKRSGDVDPIEIDNLRWMLRSELYPDNLLGEFLLRYDLREYRDAVQLFRSAGVIPTGQLSESDLANLTAKMPGDVANALREALSRSRDADGGRADGPSPSGGV
jgi:hypothetical protein